MIFDGADYNPNKDEKRLTKQHEIIRDLMKDGKMRSLSEIEVVTGYPQASISAQLRHLRKPRFGGYFVGKKRVKNTYYYFLGEKSDQAGGVLSSSDIASTSRNNRRASGDVLGGISHSAPPSSYTKQADFFTNSIISDKAG